MGFIGDLSPSDQGNHSMYRITSAVSQKMSVEQFCSVTTICVSILLVPRTFVLCVEPIICI